MDELVLFGFMAILWGAYAYIAWFRPQLYREVLDNFSAHYHHDTLAKRFAMSKVNAWITRLVVTLFFLVNVFAVIKAITKYLPKFIVTVFDMVKLTFQ